MSPLEPTLSYEKVRYHVAMHNSTSRAQWLIYNNSFNSKIRRMVRCLQYSNPEFEPIPTNSGMEGFSQVTDKSKPIFVRIIWAAILLQCASLCIFQNYNNVLKYLAEPIAVDVTMEEQQNITFPSFGLQSVDSKQLDGVLNTVLPSASRDLALCYNPLRSLLRTFDKAEAEKIWKNLSIASTISMADFVSSKQLQPLRRTEEFGLFAVNIRFEMAGNVLYEGTDSKMVLRINKSTEECKAIVPLWTSIQEKGMPTANGNIIGFRTLMTADYVITPKKFRFVSQRDKPCSDDATYLKCMDECSIKKFQNSKCRFPFMPREVNVPTCVAGQEDMPDWYTNSTMAELQSDCNCSRRCQQTVYHVSFRYVKENEHDTVIRVLFATNQVNVISERFAYDIISLLSDFGGNLGLFLGFSILSIVDVLQNALTVCHSVFLKKKLIPQPEFYGDPIVRVVKRILRNEVKLLRARQMTEQSSRNTSPIIGLNTVFDAKAPCTYRVIWFILISSAVTASCLFVYIRIGIYQTEPSRIIVKIVAKETVNFPKFTLCSEKMSIVRKYQKLARRAKVLWCNYQLTDLISRSMPAEAVWKQSSLIENYIDAYDFWMTVYGRRLVENITMREVDLPDGRCIEFTTGEQIFYGTTTQFTRIIMTSANTKMLPDLVACDRQYQTLYITPPGELFHWNTGLVYPPDTRVMLIFELKKVTLLNRPRKPCTDKVKTNICYQACFQKKLKSRLSCRLPYMPLMLHLAYCNDSQSANAAQLIYKDLVFGINPYDHAECSCVTSCDKTIVKASLLIDPTKMSSAILINAFYFTNIYEHLIEEWADSLSTLLSDIGGNLALLLDISVLSIFTMIQSIVKILIPKRKHKMITMSSTLETKHNYLRYKIKEKQEIVC